MTGERLDYLLSHQELPYIQLNQPAFERAGINEQEAEDAIVAALPAAMEALPAQPPIHTPMGMPQPAAEPVTAAKETVAKPGAKSTARSLLARVEEAHKAREAAPPPPPAVPVALQPPSSKQAPHPSLLDVFTRVQLANGALPPDEFGARIAHSYSPNGGWYVMLIPAAYQMNGNAAGTGTTHYSGWSYDRHVPLGFYGAPFQPGIYRGRVAPVDFAATFASLLGVNQPSASIGHVLTQALRPVTTTPEEPTPHPAHHAAARGSRKPASDAGGVAPE